MALPLSLAQLFRSFATEINGDRSCPTVITDFGHQQPNHLFLFLCGQGGPAGVEFQEDLAEILGVDMVRGSAGTFRHEISDALRCRAAFLVAAIPRTATEPCDGAAELISP
jgi:hypothetical protein